MLALDGSTHLGVLAWVNWGVKLHFAGALAWHFFWVGVIDLVGVVGFFLDTVLLRGLLFTLTTLFFVKADILRKLYSLILWGGRRLGHNFTSLAWLLTYLLNRIVFTISAVLVQELRNLSNLFRALFDRRVKLTSLTRLVTWHFIWEVWVLLTVSAGFLHWQFWKDNVALAWSLTFVWGVAFTVGFRFFLLRRWLMLGKWF